MMSSLRGIQQCICRSLKPLYIASECHHILDDRLDVDMSIEHGSRQWLESVPDILLGERKDPVVECLAAWDRPEPQSGYFTDSSGESSLDDLQL
jgi:hypothetical protein